MKDYIGETIKKLPFYMTFTKLVFDLKNHRKNDTPNATSHIHIFDSNLLWNKFHHIIIACYQKFPKHFENNFHRLSQLSRTIYCTTQEIHVSEYVCKTCLKELGIFFKHKKTFEKFLQAASFLKMIVFHTCFSKIPDIFFWEISSTSHL